MASDDLPHDGPSIAPPTLGLRRRRKAAPTQPPPQPEPEQHVGPEEQAAPDDTQPIAAVSPVVEPPVVEPPAVEPPVGDDAPTEVVAPRRTIFGRAARTASEVVPTPEPVPGPAPVPTPEPVPSPAPVPMPEPVPSPEPERDPVAPPEPVEPTPPPGTDPVPEPEPVSQRVQAPAIFADAADRSSQDDEPRFQDTALLTTRSQEDAASATTSTTPTAEPRERVRRLPAATAPAWFVGLGAAVVAGAVVGVVVVAATAGGLQVCTAVQGTSSCGRAGYLLLGAILVAAALVGGVLLRAAQVPDAGSTSVLAVGVMTVLALLFLVGSLFSAWMVVVIPLLGAASYALSHFVTTRVVSSDD